MKNQKLIRFAQSLIFLPIVTISTSVGNLPNSGFGVVSTASTVLSQKLNIADRPIAFNQVIDPKGIQAQIFKAQAKAIDAYFKMRNMPLEGMGMKMAIEADKNNLDWRLLPAIAIRESTGGKFECKKVLNNSFGWGSCKIGFNSNEKAIETVARNLGGNNPNTAKHYADKTVTQILRAYNPPYVVPRYAEQVMSIMKAIGSEDLGEINTT